MPFSSKKSVAVDAAIASLRLVDSAANVFPPLKAATNAALHIVETVKTFKDNPNEWADFSSRINDCINDVRPYAERKGDKQLWDNIESFTTTLEEIQVEVRSMKRRTFVQRISQGKKEVEKIAQLRTKLSDAVQRFIKNAVASVAYGITRMELTESIFDTTNPPAPAFFYGRQTEVDSIVQLIQERHAISDNSHVAITGAGGIGKTSIALTVCHDPRMAELLGENIHFVSCEAAFTDTLLMTAIATHLRISLSSQDPKASLFDGLRGLASKLVVLDNFESSWETEKQQEVHRLLIQLSSYKQLHIVLTIRENMKPAQIRWDKTVMPGVLSLESARDTFLAIASETFPSPELDYLLDEIDYMPLAVTLLANIANSGESVSTLRDRWVVERTRLLEIDNSHRLNSVNVSIKLSLNSRRMRRCPAALRLLSIVSLLPDGVALESLGDIIDLSDVEISQAPAVLKTVSLAYLDQYRRLRVLSPVRAFMEEFYFPDAGDYTSLTDHYTSLACQGWIQPDEYLSAKRLLGPEQGNISAVLRFTMRRDTQPHRAATIATAVISYSRFLAFDIPSADLLLELLKNPFVVADAHHAGPAYQGLGEIFRTQGHFQEARSALEAAKVQYECSGDRSGIAWCLCMVANITRLEGSFDDAKSAFEEVKMVFEELGDQKGATTCLQDLAGILRMQGYYDEASSALKKVKLQYETLGYKSGIAWCSWSLAEVLRLQGYHDEAKSALEEIRLQYEHLGDRSGLSWCLLSLAQILQFQQEYDEARFNAKKAESEFRSFQDKQGLYEALEILGAVHYSAGAPLLAREAWEESLEICADLGLMDDVARLTGRLAELPKLEVL